MYYRYYKIVAKIDGQTEQLFGSYNKDDCFDELVAEEETWKEQGYTAISIETITTMEAPDPEVYKGEQL